MHMCILVVHACMHAVWPIVLDVAVNMVVTLAELFVSAISRTLYCDSTEAHRCRCARGHCACGRACRRAHGRGVRYCGLSLGHGRSVSDRFAGVFGCWRVLDRSSRCGDACRRFLGSARHRGHGRARLHRRS